MALSTDIQAALIDGIDQSLREVFEMMIGEPLTLVEKDAPLKSPDAAATMNSSLTVIMGWSGDLQGSLCLTLTEAAACLWAYRLIEHQSDQADQTVIDAVGELGNMVVGGTKRRLTDFQLNMSLPSVVRAQADCVEFPSQTKPLRVRYDFASHPLVILIGLSK